MMMTRTMALRTKHPEVDPMSDQLSLKPGVNVGEFHVLEMYEEGTGGMAVVVRARHARKGHDLPEQVAVKISKLGSSDAFYTQAIKNESELLSRFNHAGVVRVFPAAHINERQKVFYAMAPNLPGRPHYFVMECLQGGSLQKLARARGALPVPEAAFIALRVGEALEYVHGNGYVHNDLKPENVLFRHKLAIGATYEPVLVDFGIAAKDKHMREDGTLQYMAPERIEKARGRMAPDAAQAVDPKKADIWSLGVLLYRMLAGREPFDAVIKGHLTTAIRQQAPRGLSQVRSDVHPQLDAWVTDRCLSKHPHHRPTIAEFNAFMRHFAGDGKVTKKHTGIFRWPWQK